MEPLIIHIFDEETQNYEYDDLEKAIDDTYSQQGIEYKKRLMVQGIDI